MRPLSPVTIAGSIIGLNPFAYFPLLSGGFTTNCNYVSAVNSGPAGGNSFAAMWIGRSRVSNFGAASNEVGKRSSGSTGWSIETLGLSLNMRLRQKDGAGVAQNLGTISCAPAGQLICGIWTFDGTTGKSYRQGIRTNSSAISGSTPAVSADLMSIAGDSGQDDVESTHWMFSTSGTAFAQLDTDAKVFAYWETVREKVRAGQLPTVWHSDCWWWYAGSMGVGTNPQTFVDRNKGLALNSLSTAPPAVRSLRKVPFAPAAYAAPTLVYPRAQSGNVAAAVSMTSYNFVLGDSVAFASEIGVRFVDYLEDGVVVATSSATPWTTSYVPTVLGSHSITARATYSGGDQLTSAAQTIKAWDGATDTPDAATIFGGILRREHIATVGVTQAGTVTKWAEANLATAFDATGAGSTAPAYTASEAFGRGGGNLPAIGPFDGVDDRLSLTDDRPAPGTQVTWKSGVYKPITLTASACFTAAGNNIMALKFAAAPANAIIRNTTASSNGAGLVANKWKRIDHYYAGAASYVQVGAAAAGTGDTGNTDPAATVFWGGRPTADFSNISMFCEVECTALPSLTQFEKWAAYLDHLCLLDVQTDR